jgi:6-phosphogluconolactonase
MDVDAKVPPQRLMIGTSNPSPDGGEGKGIYVAEFRDGALSEPVLAVKVSSPGFLAMAPNSLLFAEESPVSGDGQAATYRVGAGTSVVPLHTATSSGPGTCHLCITQDGLCAAVANYDGGSVASFRASADGALQQATFIQFPPDQHGPVASRQDKSHCHCVTVAPGGEFVLVNDLGLDRIHVFRLDHATAQLLPHRPSHWASAPGAGPRHIVCHPNGWWIFCINEVNCTVNQLRWNAADGTLTTLATISTLPEGDTAHEPRACELVFSKDLRFLYGSNRVSDTFVVYALDPRTGAPTLVHHCDNPGTESRHINIDASGKWFLSANQFSGDVSVFPIDAATGKLRPRSSSIAVDGASCLLFA